MRKIICCISAVVLVMGIPCTAAQSDYFELKSYGHFEKMVQTKEAKGVIDLKKAIPTSDGYGIGILENGRGQITVINNDVWLDYSFNI